MHPTDTAAPAHKDNLFGICAALGEDFGFNPLWLRLTLAVGLLFALEGVLMAYAGLGVIVLASRLLFPNAKRAVAEPAAVVEQPAVAAHEVEYRRAA